MKSRIIVAVLLVPLLLAVMLLTPDICFAIVVAAISSTAAYEMLTVTNTHLGKWTTGCAVLSSAAIPMGACFSVDISIIAIYCLVVLVFMRAVLAYKTEGQVSFFSIVMIVFAGGIIPLLLSSLVELRVIGKTYALIPFVIAFLSDAGAYFIGLALGKRKLIPKISPKKTVEGSIGGFLVSTVAMLVYAAILDRFFHMDVNYALALMYAILGSAVTQFGDLAFSMIKRELEIKDFGELLAEHGGMLDRFDSMIFLAPLVLVLVNTIPVF